MPDQNPSPFRNEQIQDELLSMTIFDKDWLRAVGDLIEPDDFLPLGRTVKPNHWLIAKLSIPFFRKHRVPLDSLLGMELKRWATESGASAERKDEINKFISQIRKRYDPARSIVLQEAVRDFKHEKRRQKAVRDLIELENIGQLTDEKFAEIANSVISDNPIGAPKDYLAELELRQFRRSHANRRRAPILMIDPIDADVNPIGPGNIGLWLAYYKMGKSMALIHVGTSYLFQSLNVIYVTLEDPLSDVEDRMDASIMQMAIDQIGEDREEAEIRFDRFKDKLSTRLHLVDGTEGGISMDQIDSIYERELSKGFRADAVIIDYDDEIRPPVKRPERRFEFADIYREFRKFAAHRDVIVWTAAQATRESEGREIITGKYTSEDISKIRKVTVAYGIGVGQYGEESKTINLIAHKHNKPVPPMTIWGNPKQGAFFDRDRTMAEIAKRKRTNP